MRRPAHSGDSARSLRRSPNNEPAFWNFLTYLESNCQVIIITLPVHVLRKMFNFVTSLTELLLVNSSYWKKEGCRQASDLLHKSHRAKAGGERTVFLSPLLDVSLRIFLRFVSLLRLSILVTFSSIPQPKDLPLNCFGLDNLGMICRATSLTERLSGSQSMPTFHCTKNGSRKNYDQQYQLTSTRYWRVTRQNKMFGYE